MTPAHKKLKVGVAVVVRDGDHNILLGKRLNVLGEGTWGLPGGHMKIGESVEECAKREVFEEVGISITSMQLAQVSEMVETGLDYQLVELGYICDAWEGIAELKEHKYCSEWKFFHPNELPENIFAPHAPIVQAACASDKHGAAPQEEATTLYNYIHPHFKIAVQAFVVSPDNKLLMGLRRDEIDGGNWGLPGGHLDVGETLEECVIREVEEETGLRATHALQFAQVEQPITLSNKHYLHFGYVIKDFPMTEVINGEPEDIERWEWFDLDQMPANIAPTQREMILKFLKLQKKSFGKN